MGDRDTHIIERINGVHYIVNGKKYIIYSSTLVGSGWIVNNCNEKVNRFQKPFDSFLEALESIIGDEDFKKRIMERPAGDD